MGIAPYKAFIFDGESSADYGVYITGEGVFNAPDRAVDMIEIPNRNGAFAMDQGRFSNIEVTYGAGIVDYNENNFADKISDLRNWLCSKVGYCRLEDDYNPDEYRMGIFKSGISVDHVDLKTGEFDITFECKPQRWLKSGENEQTITSGGTMTNPTLFDSNPLLAVKGYGALTFNGYELNIENAVMGNIYVAENDSFTSGKTYTYDVSLLNNGDSISVGGQLYCECIFVHSPNQIASVSTSDTNASFHSSANGTTQSGNTYTCNLVTSIDTQVWNVGTNNSITNTATRKYGVSSCQFDIVQTITYNASAKTITYSITATATSGSWTASIGSTGGVANIVINSTKSILGDPTYIDCEIGECYLIQNDEIITLNNAVILGSDLPSLSSGVNTFTFDNTITSLKVVPRWWRV